MTLRKMATACTIAVLCIPSISFQAEANGHGEVAAKDEVVYANLLANGSLKDIYVVNGFDVATEGDISDFGAYEQVINLTDLSPIEQSEDGWQVTAPAGMFYYQGNLPADTELPWIFDISYSLDGQSINPQELIGESGLVEIAIEVKQNEKADTVFFENYLLQLSVPLQSDVFHNIEAPDATIANVGKDKQAAFTVMPEESASFHLSADVEQFEFTGIEISALPASMAVEAPDTGELEEEMGTLTGAIGELATGMGEIKKGMDELADGLSQLEDGSSDYQAGSEELALSGDELVQASSEIEAGLYELSSSLSEASAPEADVALDDTLFAAFDELSAGMSEAAAGLEELSTHYGEAYGALKAAVESIPESDLTEEDIQTLYESNPNSDTLAQLVAYYQAGQEIKGTYAAVKEGLDAVQPVLEESKAGLEDIAAGIDELASSLQEALGAIDIGEGFAQLSEGIDEVASQYSQFHEGLADYTGGVSQLNDSYAHIHEGIGETAEGSTELSSGMEDIHNGAKELEEATADVPEQMQAEIDDMLSQYDKSDFEPVSFVSPENNDVIENVQFVFQTERLTLPEETQTEEDNTEENVSLWQRFLQLFGLGD
ncbi:hypothetical protein CHH78_12895 [Shouchella clausii]|uniref:hypothetical protein n=1 Tax=Shouchella clausii TaxID=79880 RepID=UPI000BA57D9F|nr:hypothetical protein [Shouchella clausii]MBU8597456.1 YhgE/Pip domain-containing protein [Shouchella clausii]MCY1105118.1 YhgE/Pip domain-containing protein [Shouchella clausii]MED4158974.1 YhgE/Pip domain-containing protein [Shouchella clausii]MED4176893.1 YhgE/Pip domain-containing protein [Shouchella clausii]PAD08422.1 hypothetical protein CHH76_14800 [Shouchella clausii]